MTDAAIISIPGLVVLIVLVIVIAVDAKRKRRAEEIEAEVAAKDRARRHVEMMELYRQEVERARILLRILSHAEFLRRTSSRENHNG